jgi:hypothetical protein
MTNQDALQLLNVALKQVQTINATRGFTGGTFVKERLDQLNSIFAQIREIRAKVGDNPLPPEAQHAIDSLMETVRDTYKKFPASSAAFKDRNSSMSLMADQCLNKVMSDFGKLLHATNEDTLRTYWHWLEDHEIDQGIKVIQLIEERILAPAESGNVKALDKFIEMFKEGANLRQLREWTVTDANGDKKKIETGEDLLLLKEQNPKRFHVLFAQARGTKALKEPNVQKKIYSILGDVKLPSVTQRDYTEKVRQAGKFADIGDAAAAGVKSTSKSQNNSRLRVIKNRE